MTTPRAARRVHRLTALVAAVAIVLQLVLVIDGAATLLPEENSSLGTRLVRFFSYFTILANLLVLAVTVSLARDPDRNDRVWRVLRLDAVVCIAVTGVVHWFFLRPLLDLSGASYVADKMLHVVVPILAVSGWLWVGPRGRASRSELLPSLVLPVVWLVLTLVGGALTGWYPYPFLDVDDLGYVRVAVNTVGVAVLFLLIAASVIRLERRLDRRPMTPADG
ncbi:MAG: Pr6Pr family membrane protein [Nocardioidaceae bacterium]|nr:Pr6Pr family membrane protein [Nocardioidaceae bacterium]